MPNITLLVNDDQPSLVQNAGMAQNQWIEQRLKELEGRNKAGLAKALGLPAPRISDIIKGRRGINALESKRIADYLQMNIADVVDNLEGRPSVGGAPAPVKIPVVGSVAAGVWREALEVPEYDWEYVPAILNPKLESLPSFALRVSGASMDKVFPNGTILICIKFFDMELISRGPETGDYVIVQQRNSNGLVEATCKQLEVEDGQAWLWPRSTRPEFQTPIKVEDNGEEDSVLLHALVVGYHGTLV